MTILLKKLFLIKTRTLFILLFLSSILITGCDKGDHPIVPDDEEETGDTLIHGGIGTTTPYIKGTFIDFWGKENWTGALWDTHMQEMKELGIGIIFVQFSAYNEQIWCDSPNDYSTDIHKNALTDLLSAAERNEMNVFVGLYFNENYWQNASNPDEMSLHAQRSMDLSDDIWKSAKHNKSFAGWYISQEAAPYYYDTEAKFNVLKNNLINPIAYHCKSISDKPVTTTVFFNHDLTSTSDFRLFMKRISKCSLDAILLQDGTGVGHCNLAELNEYFQAANDGLFTDGNFKGAFWADMETFTPQSKPESFTVIEEKLSIIAPLVRNIVIFQYYTDMCPTGPGGSEASKLRNDYLNYLP